MTGLYIELPIVVLANDDISSQWGVGKGIAFVRTEILNGVKHAVYIVKCDLCPVL